jgi:hypothetical protein
MIKDIIVNLEHRTARGPARDFAITIAETCDAHVAGVALERFEGRHETQPGFRGAPPAQGDRAAAPVVLSALARRFDLSVFMQSEPNVWTTTT